MIVGFASVTQVSGTEEADHRLARAAVKALLDELEAYPKPGLVSPVDSGSHSDMDFILMCRSAEALFEPFAELAARGRAGQPFEAALLPAGIEAERRMLTVTRGVNTHRGAIFSLGMIVAAVARATIADLAPTPDAIRATLRRQWGHALEIHAARGTVAGTHGAVVRRATGHAGARREAALAFPSVFDVALPAYRNSLRWGLDSNAACIQTLFTLMAQVDDTTVLYRGGIEGAAFVRDAASSFLAAGGCFESEWHGRAEGLHRAFVERSLSPGGCADLLACAMLVSHCCAANP